MNLNQHPNFIDPPAAEALSSSLGERETIVWAARASRSQMLQDSVKWLPSAVGGVLAILFAVFIIVEIIISNSTSLELIIGILLICCVLIIIAYGATVSEALDYWSDAYAITNKRILIKRYASSKKLFSANPGDIVKLHRSCDGEFSTFGLAAQNIMGGGWVAIRHIEHGDEVERLLQPFVKSTEKVSQ